MQFSVKLTSFIANIFSVSPMGHEEGPWHDHSRSLKLSFN